MNFNASAAALSAIVLGMSAGAAYAVPAAYSWAGLDVSNFTVSTTGGLTTGARTDQGTSNSQAGFNFGVGFPNSSELDNGAIFDGTTTSRDADPTEVGSAAPGKANNDFTAADRMGNYGRGDSILSGSVAGAGFPTVLFFDQLGEAYRDTTSAGVGNQRPSNGSGSTTFSSTFVTGATGGGLAFQFDAEATLENQLVADGEDITGAQAGSFINFIISVVDNTNADTEVFRWSPGGDVGGIVGGTELSDPYNLQATRSQNVAGSILFAPGSGTFEANTLAGLLAANNTYTLTVSANAESNVLLVSQPAATAVPVPASLALIGLGLICVARTRRS